MILISFSESGLLDESASLSVLLTAAVLILLVLMALAVICCRQKRRGGGKLPPNPPSQSNGGADKALMEQRPACRQQQHEVKIVVNKMDDLLNHNTHQGWKFMSCSHCQKLGQQASWLLIGCTRVKNQSWKPGQQADPTLDHDYNS